jgi:hypothetical protein
VVERCSCCNRIIDPISVDHEFGDFWYNNRSQIVQRENKWKRLTHKQKLLLEYLLINKTGNLKQLKEAMHLPVEAKNQLVRVQIHFLKGVLRFVESGVMLEKDARGYYCLTYKENEHDDTTGSVQ